MQISSALSFQAARAYGVKPAHAHVVPQKPVLAPAQSATATQRAAIIDPPASTHSLHTMQMIAAAQQPSAAIQQLIAGHVPGRVDFDAASRSPASPALALYTRAADRIEAATAIQIGRALDLRG